MICIICRKYIFRVFWISLPFSSTFFRYIFWNFSVWCVCYILRMRFINFTVSVHFCVQNDLLLINFLFYNVILITVFNITVMISWVDAFIFLKKFRILILGIFPSISFLSRFLSVARQFRRFTGAVLTVRRLIVVKIEK